MSVRWTHLKKIVVQKSLTSTCPVGWILVCATICKNQKIGSKFKFANYITRDTSCGGCKLTTIWNFVPFFNVAIICRRANGRVETHWLWLQIPIDCAITFAIVRKKTTLTTTWFSVVIVATIGVFLQSFFITFPCANLLTT
jgi:hypothetical protein